MKKYTYENLKTGQMIDSDEPINDPDLKLIKEIRTGQMKANEIKTK